MLANTPRRNARENEGMLVNCFKCGSPEHLVAQCPNRTRPREAPASALAPPALEDWMPPRVEPYECADPEIAHRNAAGIRAAMGWSEDERARRLRDLALRQVKEARASRV